MLRITCIVLMALIVIPFASHAETIDVLIKGINDGARTTKQQDYKKAVLFAKREAIERAGVKIKALTTVKDLVVNSDYIESKAEGVLLPGYDIIDVGYQTDGTYLIVLSGKIEAKSGVDSRKYESGSPTWAESEISAYYPDPGVHWASAFALFNPNKGDSYLDLETGKTSGKQGTLQLQVNAKKNQFSLVPSLKKGRTEDLGRLDTPPREVSIPVRMFPDVSVKMEPKHYYYVRSGDFHIVIKIKEFDIGTKMTLKPENWLVHPVTVRFDHVFSTKSVDDLNSILRNAAPAEGVSNNGAINPGEFRQKVQMLKDLRNEGLLTQQEFEEKLRMLSKDL